ncbi:MAG: choice-of-anchor tandem repeat GloVer-containing protein, partial [Candidatus Cybelea sp.]
MKHLCCVIGASVIAALITACNGNGGVSAVPNAFERAHPASKTGYKVLHRFQGGTDGELPAAGLAVMNGVLYGTTEYGGAAASCTDIGIGCGTVFSITPSGKESVIYAFKGTPGNDGEVPYASVLPVNGLLYGTTPGGGSPGPSACLCGVIFSVTLSGKETVVHYFGGGNATDGSGPYSPLIAANGSLYGTTSGGGGCPRPSPSPCYEGTVFEITPSSGYQIIHAFLPNSPDGTYPSNGGLFALGGTLYGTTITGGGSNVRDVCSYGYGLGCGTVFSVSYSGSESVIYRFRPKGNGGNSPVGGVILVNGMLYGTTSEGGSHDCGDNKCGTIFEVSPSGTGYQVLHQFKGTKDGANPQAALIEVNGMLYGTTFFGGSRGPTCCGTV